MKQPLTWRKSSYSQDGPNCVELADAGSDVLVRDSKHPDQGHLTLARADVASLIEAAKAGVLDGLL
jgi:hypothetical protein